MDCVPGEVAPNLEKIDSFAEGSARAGAGLAVFPECATTGYFIADRLATLAEPANGPVIARLAATAQRHRLHLAVGLAVTEGGRFYDAQALLSPVSGLLGLYRDRKSTRLNSSHSQISYAVFCLKKKTNIIQYKCRQYSLIPPQCHLS